MTSTSEFDQMSEDDLYDIRERLEAGRPDGWILLVTLTQPSTEGFVNVLSTPDVDLERSLLARMSPFANDGFKIIDVAYVYDRRTAFDKARQRASEMATEAHTGSEKNQWFKITEANAAAVLTAIA